MLSRCMSHLIFGLTPSWLWPFSRIGSLCSPWWSYFSSSLPPLLPTSSLFSLPPRVFGCVSFVQDHSPSLSKLAPHALKGVFVGYSRTQKGYRVYFPDTRRYMSSADVTFHEDSPFFSPPSPSPTPTAASPPLGFLPLVVISDPYPSVPPPPLFLSSPSPHVSSVQPVSSSRDTNPLSPNSTTDNMQS